MKCRWAAGIVIGLLASWVNAEAQDLPPQDPASKPSLSAPAAPTPRKPRHSKKHRLVRAAPVAAARATGVATAAPGQDTAGTPGVGNAGGASGTASGISGARRVGNVRGETASPTTPTTLPPGTLDLGHGVTLQANYTSETAGNPFGGLGQGVRYADQFLLGVDADLGKLVGLDGSSIHAIGTQRDGRSLSGDLLGNSISVQEIYGGGQTIRLAYLSFEQKLLDDRVDLEVGRLPGQVAFLASPLYCNFQNNTLCGSPNVAFSDTDFTFFPAPTWAGTLKTKLTDKVFFNVGAYEVAPSSVLSSDHGVDFFAPATGFNVPFELGYATTFDNDPMPRHYGAGAIIDQSTYSDPVLDKQGGQFVLTGLDPQQRFGRSAAYQRFDQMVWRPDPTSPRGLTLFGLAIEGTGGRQIEDYELEFGAVETGLFESRPFDTIDFAVSTQHFSDLGIANVVAARRSLGLGTGNIATQETFLELNYGLQVSPAIRLTPNVQYVIDPDQLREPFRPKPIPDFLVFGAKLSVDLFTLAGLAKGPGSL